jgi:uncharacterized membrane protein YecN with MAPEG domain
MNSPITIPLVPITALYAALNATLNVGLGVRISQLRRKLKISVGTSDSKEMMLAVRIHANNAEFVPLALLMMLICELCGGKSAPLHVFGGLLFIARVSHAFGMPRRAPNPYRFAGTATTWLIIFAASIYAIILRRA